MKKKLIELLASHGELSVLQLTQRLSISRQMIHRILKELIEKGEIEKIGKAPELFIG